MASREVFLVDIAFARLELLELEHGKRTLTQCPGLKAMAAHIAEAEAKLREELRCTCGRPECGGFECTRNNA